MFKKILAALLTVIFTVMLFGCSRETESNVSEVSRAEELSADESGESDASAENSESIETSEPEQDDANPYVSYEYDDLGRVSKKIGYDIYKEPYEYTDYIYDENGNCVKELHSSYDGVIDYIIDREFNSAGREAVVISKVTPSNVRSRREYYYNEDGKLTKVITTYTNIAMGDQVEIYGSDEIMLTCTFFDPDGTLATIEEFDKDGNMTKYIRYNPDGSINEILECVFDRKGRYVESYYYEGSENLKSRHEYEYDDMNNCTRALSYDSDGNETYHFEREYDGMGRTLRETQYNPDGEITYLVEREYSESGKILYRSEYDIRWGNDRFEYTEYIRNEDETSLKIFSYDKDGVITYGSAYEYDENGREIKSLYYNDGTFTTCSTTEYNDETYEITNYNSDGTVYSVGIYNYNGKQIEKNVYYPNGQIEQCIKTPRIGFCETIDYDEEGNITSREVVEEGARRREWKRIKYDSEGNIISGIENEYDIYGRKIKYTCISGGERTVIEYDEDGNPIEE